MLLALGAGLMLALSLLPAAHAHDTLIATDPEDGATLETSPEELTLTFSADVLDVSPVVRISDEEGETLTEITPRVEGPDAIAEIEEPLPAGTHTVQWRVVSSDGHPIEGTFTITVEQDAAPEEGADEGEQPASDGGGGQTEAPAPISEEAGGDEAEGDEAEGAEGSAPTSEESEGESAGSTLPLLLGVIGVAVIGVAIAAFFALRRKSPGQNQGPGSPAQDEGPDGPRQDENRDRG